MAAARRLRAASVVLGRPGLRGPAAPPEVYEQMARVAVDAELARREVLEAGPIHDAEPAFAVTDTDGRRSWVEAGADGKPTAHAATLIAEATAPMVEALIPQEVADLPDASGWVFAITDDENRIAFGIRADGSTTAGRGGTIGESRLPIVGWGTSMMDGQSGAGTTLLTVVGDELGVTTLNHGGNGMRSPGIAAQQGGNPAMLTVEGGVIPASGSVNVTVDAAVMVDTFYYWTGNGAWPGTLMGVPGTLSYPQVDPTAGPPAVFTRSVPGDPVTVFSPRPFLPATARYRDNITLFWAGHNDMAKREQVFANYRAMVEFLTHEQYLVLSELNSYANDEDDFNASLAEMFPYSFVDLKAWLIRYGLDQAGITPTAQDSTDIANGVVPSSLRADGVHLNAAGYLAAGHYVAQIITEKGWLD